MKPFAVALLVVAAVCSTALAQETPATPQGGVTPQTPVTPPAPPPALCPVTKKPIDRTIATLYHDKWVYFASKEAQATFQKNPNDYLEGVKEQLLANPVLRVQIKCPVTKNPPKPNIYVGAGEDAICFATEDAKASWQREATPEQRRFLEAECYTFQSRCGTCSMDIKPESTLKVDGKTVYFCCDGCAKKFEEQLAANLKKVDEQITANQKAYIYRQLEKLVKLQAEAKAQAPTSQPQPASH
jgi:YHS domain-containing protein